jgi:hypothetical protein
VARWWTIRVTFTAEQLQFPRSAMRGGRFSPARGVANGDSQAFDTGLRPAQPLLCSHQSNRARPA